QRPSQRRAGRRSPSPALGEESQDPHARGVQRTPAPSLRRMRVLVRESAETDLDDIAAWIGKDNPAAARRVVAAIRNRINVLETDELAHMGRPGTVAETRGLIEYPYIIVYRVDDERREVVVLSIMHGARDREQ